MRQTHLERARAPRNGFHLDVRLTDGQLTLSPSDLSGFLACEHLTTLDIGVGRGDLVRPIFDDDQRDLIQRKGEEHEVVCAALASSATEKTTFACKSLCSVKNCCHSNIFMAGRLS